jgi:DNA-binding GntR family transcriptional regulator
MIEKNPLYVQIEAELRSDILSGRLRPGERISIDELAGRWKVSSTPVRDAIRMLEWKGFVEVRPRRTVRVVKLDKQAIRDLFDIRIALECMAVESACPVIPLQKINEALLALREAHRQFEKTGDREVLAEVDTLVHDLVIQHCDNARLIQNIDGLCDVIGWVRSFVVQRPKSYESAYSEHVAVLEALQVKDPAQASAAMKSHLRNACARTISTE